MITTIILTGIIICIAAVINSMASGLMLVRIDEDAQVDKVIARIN
jgi:hypothetical protein